MFKKTMRILTSLTMVLALVVGMLLTSPVTKVNAYTSEIFDSRAHYSFYLEREVNNGYIEDNLYRSKYPNEVEDEYKIGETYKVGLRILIFTLADGDNVIEPGQMIYEFPETFKPNHFLNTGEVYFEEGKEIEIAGTIWSTRVQNNRLQIFNRVKFDPNDPNSATKALYNRTMIFKPDKIQDYHFTLIGYDNKNGKPDVNGGFSYNIFDLILKSQKHVSVSSDKLNVTASIEGGVLKQDKSFEYLLEQVGISDGVILPSVTKITTEGIRTGKTNSIAFDELIFTTEGVYTFTITQSASGIEGMVDAQSQTVKIAVLKVDDQLLAEVVEPQSGGNLTFVNVYTPITVNTANDRNSTYSLILLLMSIIGIGLIRKSTITKAKE